MQTVTVKKIDLINQLTENRERHVNTFEQVLEDYRTRAIELLEEHIDRIRQGNVERVEVFLPPPQNYEESYNTAIEMLEWEERIEVELTQREFKQYVQDEWSWKQDFTEAVTTYSRS
jgi:rubrerythrin